jgi:hypothetical protein
MNFAAAMTTLGLHGARDSKPDFQRGSPVFVPRYDHRSPIAQITVMPAYAGYHAGRRLRDVSCGPWPGSLPLHELGALEYVWGSFNPDCNSSLGAAGIRSRSDGCGSPAYSQFGDRSAQVFSLGGRHNLATNREMLWDWWPQEVSEQLQQFYQDLKDGKRPKIAIMAPPQHGKSTAATDFITWVAGKDPNLKTIFASFSDTLGERTNKEVQRILRTDAYIKIFGRTRLDIPGWSTNTSLIEFGDFNGSFRNTTVEGSIRSSRPCGRRSIREGRGRASCCRRSRFAAPCRSWHRRQIGQ